MTKRDKITVDDIIGIVHTDETTNSVEEVRKLRGRTNERFIIDDTGTLIDMVTRDTFDYVSDVVGLLNEQRETIISLQVELDTHKHPLWSTREAERIVNELKEENKQLKSEIKDLNDVLARYEEKELEND